MIRIATSIIVFVLLLPSQGYTQAHSRIDSLQNLIETAIPEDRVRIFCEISEAYWQRSYDTSLIMAVRANNIAQDLDNQGLIATSLYMIGNAHYLLGNYPNSMDHYLQALQIRKELGDSNYIAGSYNNIGAVYLLMNDEQLALKYFKEAYEIFQGLGDDNQLFEIVNNIGAVYIDNEIFDTAYQYFIQAYEIAEKNQNETNLSIALTNLGKASLSMGLYMQSEDYQLKAYEISKKLDDRGMMATIKSNLGEIYMRSDNFPSALNAFQESLLLAREINSLPIIQENFKNLSDYYNLKGQHKEALRFFKMYSSVKDSLLSLEGITQIKEMELKFNARSLQQEIELLQMENEIQNLKGTRLKYGIISLIVIILGLILLFTAYFQRNRFKKKTNQILEDKNKQLEKANKKLLESENHLKKLNSTKDKFFSIIGHDLRNPLNALLGFSELMSGNSREYSSEEIQKYSKIINEAAKNIHQLIENLLEWSRSQSGSIEFNPHENNLFPVVKEIVDIFQIQAEKKEIGLESNIPEDILVFADRNLLSTILRNLVNNAVKFTPKKGKVIISSVQTDEGPEISVKDSGVGMTEEQIETLFSLVHGPSTPGTAEEKGTGLGLILCKEFVDKHGGRIWAESERGKGSTFTLFLPNKK